MNQNLKKKKRKKQQKFAHYLKKLPSINSEAANRPCAIVKASFEFAMFTALKSHQDRRLGIISLSLSTSNDN